MTQQEVQAHPYWQRFQARLGPVINALGMRGMISQNEAGMLQQMLRNSYPMMHNFIENLNMRYDGISDQQMDNEICTWLQPAIQQVKMRVQQMMCSRPAAFGGGGFGGGFGGGGMGFGGGIGSGIPTSPFGGGGGVTPNPNAMGFGRNLFEAPNPGATPSVPKMIGGGNVPPQTPRAQHIATQMNQREVRPAVDARPWKAPEIVEAKDAINVGDITVLETKFNLCDDTVARRIIVRDPRVRYLSDQDVLSTYKPVFDLYPETRRKFLTVFYKKLQILHVGHDEFMKLAQALVVAVGKANNVENKLRAIVSTLRGASSVAAMEEFTKLFLDELDAHIQCGELCDSTHPKNILNRPDKIEDVLSWITGDIDKNMLAAMKGMEGFEERLNSLLEILIDMFVMSLPKIVVNPRNDMSVLSAFSRAIPGIWTNDGGCSLFGSEDLVNIFIATRETVEGSKSANAQQSESILKSKLAELDKNFTMIFLPRVVSWCNYSKMDVCRYDNSGNCQPTVSSPKQPNSDVEFFVSEVISKMDIGKDTRAKWSPKNIYMEIDEETYCLQYGKTTNNCNWICCSKYWH